MKLPSGIESFRSIKAWLVACLLQNLYSLRQFDILWNQKVVDFFTSFKFKIINADLNILIWHKRKDKMILISVYIDKFLIAAKHQKSVNLTKKKLKKEYNVKYLEEVKTIIEWQVIQNQELFILKINQSAFIRSIFEEDVMQDCNPVNTTMKIGNFIEMQNDNYKEVSLKVYQALISKLIYLLYGT